MRMGIGWDKPVEEWREICFGRHPHRTLARVAAWGIVCISLFHFLLLPVKIVGSSMTPTYNNGSVNFINRLAYVRHEPRRGDVVALWFEDEMLIKRVVGLPGERVAIRDGLIQINGLPLQDRFVGSKPLSPMPAILLEPGEFFVIGDNRETSLFGRIAKSHLIGKVVF